MTQQIKSAQMHALSEDWTARVVDALCGVLRRRFAAQPDSPAARRCAAEPAVLRPYVDAVVRRASGHGFSSQADLQALVDGCLEHGAEHFLSDAVLQRPDLNPRLKLSLMARLAQHARTLGAPA